MLRGTVDQPAPRMQSSSSRLRRFKPELSPKPLYRDGVTPRVVEALPKHEELYAKFGDWLSKRADQKVASHRIASQPLCVRCR